MHKQPVLTTNYGFCDLLYVECVFIELSDAFWHVKTRLKISLLNKLLEAYFASKRRILSALFWSVKIGRPILDERFCMQTNKIVKHKDAGILKEYFWEECDILTQDLSFGNMLKLYFLWEPEISAHRKILNI